MRGGSDGYTPCASCLPDFFFLSEGDCRSRADDVDNGVVGLGCEGVVGLCFRVLWGWVSFFIFFVEGGGGGVWDLDVSVSSFCLRWNRCIGLLIWHIRGCRLVLDC